MKTLSGKVILQPLWTTYMQCLKGMSDYLGLGHSTAWIFGGTGNAFIMNIHPTLCPSGPTAFSQLPLNVLATNLGLELHGVSAFKNDPDFAIHQKAAWEAAQLAIDNDWPVLGWELGLQEFFLINGYDKENYLFYNLNGLPEKKKWNTLGDSEIGWLYLFSANQGKKISTQKMLKEAFIFALAFAKKQKDWTYPDYANGTKAYDIWMNSLQNISYEPMGLAYNSQVWSECRTYAVEFLKEVKKKMKTKLLDNLIEHYEVVAWSLQKVAKLFPMGRLEPDSDLIDQAVDTLFLAQEAEKAALAEMRAVLSQL